MPRHFAYEVRVLNFQIEVAYECFSCHVAARYRVDGYQLIFPGQGIAYFDGACDARKFENNFDGIINNLPEESPVEETYKKSKEFQERRHKAWEAERIAKPHKSHHCEIDR